MPEYNYGKLYILNTTIAIPDKDCIIKMKRMTLSDAKQFLYERNYQFTSAIGHEATAKLLSKLFECRVPVNRIAAVCIAGQDITLCFKLKERIPEGKILTDDEILKLEYEFWLMGYFTEDGDSGNFSLRFYFHF